MPIFNNMFIQKKVSQRKLFTFQRLHGKSEDCTSFNSRITLNLGDLITAFDDGNWNSQLKPLSETKVENLKLKKTIYQLEEENNLLKLKNEILLDMITSQVIISAGEIFLPYSQIRMMEVLLQSQGGTGFKINASDLFVHPTPSALEIF